MLLDAVDKLIGALDLSPAGEVLASSLRTLATRIDDGSASDAVSAQLNRELVQTLERLTEVSPDAAAPEIGSLRGNQARAVLLGLGYPPEEVDGISLQVFDSIEALRLRRDRRLRGLPVQPGLQAVIDRAIRDKASERNRFDDAT